MPLFASRSLSQAGAEPPPADDAITADPATPADDQPPVEDTALAPAPSSPKVFALKDVNVTAVSTVGQLRRAVEQVALDIEIRAHLDLRPLLQDVRAEPVGNSPDLVRDRESALDALAMLELNVRTRSIRGNCSDPDAAAALKLPAGGAGGTPLLPLKPFQCLLLVPDTFLAVPTGRLWLDNLYLRLQPRSPVLTSLQRTPSFLALGRLAPNTRFSDYSWRNDWPDETELHVTDVTFQGDGVRSVHAVKAAAIGKETIAHFRDCIFTDWGGRAPPVVAARFSTASIAQTVFLNMRQQAEIVDVSFNGAVRFESVTFAGAGGPPKGRVVGTSMNDYSRSPAIDSFELGVYYPGDDANYDVEVEEIQEDGGAFGANRVITNAIMSDCLFQAYEEDANAPQPGCPPESMQARAAVRARMLNETATPVLLTDPEVYYDAEEDPGYGGASVYGGGTPFNVLDQVEERRALPDYEYVQPPGAPPAAVVSLPPISAPAPSPSDGVPSDYDYSGAPLEYAPGGAIIAGSVDYGPGGFDASAPYDGGDYSYGYDSYGGTAYQYGYDKPAMSERLQALEEPSPWFAGMQRVMPERLPTPPGWPQLSIPQPAADVAETDAAQLLLPLSTQDPAELVSPGDAEAAASSRDGNDTIFTAGVVALFVAAFLAAAICAFAALLRRRRPAAWKEGLKAREAAAGGMVAGGIVGGGKGGDAASHAAAKLGRQLDLYGADDLFMEKYELLGRDRGSRGSKAFVQHARGHEDGRLYAIKFFLDRDAFAAEATLYAAFQPFLRASLGSKLAGAAEAAGDAAPPNAPPARDFLPAIHDIVGVADWSLNDPAGRPLPPCIVMDKGVSLQEWSDNAPADLFTALAMLTSVSKRLAALHDAGYVHRDLKPSKVMLTSSNKQWTVVGLSRAVRVGTQAPMEFTLAYAAPETVQAFASGADVLEVRPPVDAWALGVMAFELLTATPAFELLVDGQGKAIAQLKGEEELPWEDTSNTHVVAKLGMLRDAVLSLLARDPAKRATVKQFHAACTKAFAEGTAQSAV